MRNKAEDHREEREKMKQDETREETNRKRLLIIGNKLRVGRGEGGEERG